MGRWREIWGQKGSLFLSEGEISICLQANGNNLIESKKKMNM